MSVEIRLLKKFVATFSIEDGWECEEAPELAKLLTDVQEDIPMGYYIDPENAIAEFCAQQLDGEVVKLNEVVPTPHPEGVVY